MYSVIFDMDGVIFDTERIISDLWREVADEHSIPNIDEAIHRCIGITDAATKKVFEDLYGIDFPYGHYKKMVSVRFHERCDGGRIPTKPGIRELLTFLKSKNIKTAVASSTRTAVVMEEIRDAGLSDFFDVIIGGDKVTHSKPNPEIFLLAAETLGEAPCDCYVIEDSFNGIRAARGAGMHPVMVPDMLAPDDEILSLSEAVFPSLLEVREFFDKKE